MITLIIFIVSLSVLVVIHEYGHYIMAKLSGIKVEEFALGMGPKIAGVQKGETLFSIRAFPLGGFCKMLGEDQNNQDPRAFNSKPVFKRIAVIVFGPIMNLLLAIIILSIVYIPIPRIGAVVDNKPAKTAGIVAGDRIAAINQTEITRWEQIPQQISKSNGNKLHVRLENKGKYRELDITPVLDKQTNQYVIGIAPSAAAGGYSLKQGVQTSWYITTEMLKYLSNALRGKASLNDISGPVGIYNIMNDAKKAGYMYVLNITAILSLNLFLFNLLPIPALDGGRLIFLFLEAIRRKPVNPEKEGLVHFIGFVLLMGLSVLILYRDLIKIDVLKNLFR